MEKYAKKTPLASFADHFLLRLTLIAVGLGWFIFLWGVSLPALLAGLALGLMMALGVRLFQRMTVSTREKQMRRMIGGELALDELVLLPIQRAAFQATLWLTPQFPLEMTRTTRDGVLCKLEEKKVLVRLLAHHPSVSASVDDVLDARREAMALGADGCLLCLTSPAAKEAEACAQTGSPRIRLVSRKEMIALAGLSSPATDEQLATLSRKKKKHAGARQWVRLILARSRSKRYFFYGLGMAALYFITGLPYYPVPAVLCLSLCVLSRVYRPKAEKAWLD